MDWLGFALNAGGGKRSLRDELPGAPMCAVSSTVPSTRTGAQLPFFLPPKPMGGGPQRGPPPSSWLTCATRFSAHFANAAHWRCRSRWPVHAQHPGPRFALAQDRCGGSATAVAACAERKCALQAWAPQPPSPTATKLQTHHPVATRTRLAPKHHAPGLSRAHRGLACRGFVLRRAFPKR